MIIYIYIYIYIIVRPDNSVVRASTREARNRGLESHSGQLFICNKKA